MSRLDWAFVIIRLACISTVCIAFISSAPVAINISDTAKLAEEIRLIHGKIHVLFYTMMLWLVIGDFSQKK